MRDTKTLVAEGISVYENALKTGHMGMYDNWLRELSQAEIEALFEWTKTSIDKVISIWEKICAGDE